MRKKNLYGNGAPVHSIKCDAAVINKTDMAKLVGVNVKKLNDDVERLKWRRKCLEATRAWFIGE